jgi:ribosomal-protein-serine acetyltransferase
VQEQLSVTDEIKLRLLEETDAQELHALIESNRAQLAGWLPWAEGQGFEETLEFVRKTRSQAAENHGFQAAVVLDGDIVGMVGYPGVDWINRSTRIGYWLDEAHQSRGIATAAVRVLVEHALSVWRLNRVEIHAATENERSRAIPEHLGFRMDGTLRQAQLVGGRYLDYVLYSMLAADNRATSPPIIGLDHVQVAAPLGSEGEARMFYGELVGLVEVEKPEALRGAAASGSPAAPNNSTLGSPTDSHLQPGRTRRCGFADQISTLSPSDWLRPEAPCSGTRRSPGRAASTQPIPGATG